MKHESSSSYPFHLNRVLFQVWKELRTPRPGDALVHELFGLATRRAGGSCQEGVLSVLTCSGCWSQNALLVIIVCCYKVLFICFGSGGFASLFLHNRPPPSPKIYHNQQQCVIRSKQKPMGRMTLGMEALGR